MNPGLRRDGRTRSIQLAQELREITVARLFRCRLESAAKRGSNAGMRGQGVDADDPSIHVQLRRRGMFNF